MYYSVYMYAHMLYICIYIILGDCAINVNPNSDELAQIAVSSAETALAFGIEPRVAMLSYATGDSNKGPMSM